MQLLPFPTLHMPITSGKNSHTIVATPGLLVTGVRFLAPACIWIHLRLFGGDFGIVGCGQCINVGIGYGSSDFANQSELRWVKQF